MGGNREKERLYQKQGMVRENIETMEWNVAFFGWELDGGHKRPNTSSLSPYQIVDKESER